MSYPNHFTGEDSFDLQLIEHLPFLEKAAERYYTNSDDMKDLVQDTLYKAIKHKKKFKNNSNFKGWLITILRNTFINNYNKKKKSISFVDCDFQNIDNKSNVELVLDDSLLHYEYDLNVRVSEEYMYLLETVPYEQQLILLMCDIEGYSYKEIAEFCGCPVGTIRSRLYRCRKIIYNAYRKALRTGKF
jgi:RNA polymerase sigma-70 factor (ECF subfamily)